MAETETDRLRRAVLRCRSPWHIVGVDALITRSDRGRRNAWRLDDAGRALLALAHAFLDSPADTPLAERRWWRLRQTAMAQQARSMAGDELVVSS